MHTENILQRKESGVGGGLGDLYKRIEKSANYAEQIS